jgi:hypothetical protein
MGYLRVCVGRSPELAAGRPRAVKQNRPGDYGPLPTIGGIFHRPIIGIPETGLGPGQATLRGRGPEQRIRVGERAREDSDSDSGARRVGRGGWPGAGGPSGATGRDPDPAADSESEEANGRLPFCDAWAFKFKPSSGFKFKLAESRRLGQSRRLR